MLKLTLFSNFRINNLHSLLSPWKCHLIYFQNIILHFYLLPTPFFSIDLLLHFSYLWRLGARSAAYLIKWNSYIQYVAKFCKSPRESSTSVAVSSYFNLCRGKSGKLLYLCKFRRRRREARTDSIFSKYVVAVRRIRWKNRRKTGNFCEERYWIFFIYFLQIIAKVQYRRLSRIFFLSFMPGVKIPWKSVAKI